MTNLHLAFAEIAGAITNPAKTKRLWDRQDDAIDDFRAGFATVMMRIDRKLNTQFDRGDWTFTVQDQKFSAVLREGFEFPGFLQVRIDRIMEQAGFTVFAIEDMRCWVGEAA